MRAWVAGLALIVAGCGGGKAAAPTTTARTSFEITGVVRVPPFHVRSTSGTFRVPDPVHEGDTCLPDDGYDDLGAGGQVTVKDEGGKVIGSTSLRAGHIGFLEAGGSRIQRCVFDIAPVTVPKASFYQVEAGHRKPVSYSFAELTTKNWRVELSVG